MTWGLNGRDAYEVLEVEPDASADEIKRSYRRLVRAYHPDVRPPGDPDTGELLGLVMRAYDVLTERRAEYDRHRAKASPEKPARTDAPAPSPPQTFTPPRGFRTIVALGIGCAGLVALVIVVTVLSAALGAFRTDQPDVTTGVPRDFAGTWQGTYTPTAGTKTAVSITLGVGWTRGRIDYDQGHCDGSVTPISYTDGVLWLQTIAGERGEGCENADLRVTLDKGMMHVTYHHDGAASNATSTLTRRF